MLSHTVRRDLTAQITTINNRQYFGKRPLPVCLTHLQMGIRTLSKVNPENSKSNLVHSWSQLRINVKAGWMPKCLCVYVWVCVRAYIRQALTSVRVSPGVRVTWIDYQILTVMHSHSENQI